jgi:hypothetical protein
MRTTKIVLAISLLAASTLASAAGPETYTPSAQMGDTFIMQTSVSSAVQISVSAEAGSAQASLGNNTSVAPTAELDYTSYLNLPIVKPVTTVSEVSPESSVNGKGSASVLVTQDVNALLAVPTSAINAVVAIGLIGFPTN